MPEQPSGSEHLGVIAAAEDLEIGAARKRGIHTQDQFAWTAFGIAIRSTRSSSLPASMAACIVPELTGGTSAIFLFSHPERRFRAHLHHSRATALMRRSCSSFCDRAGPRTIE